MDEARSAPPPAGAPVGGAPWWRRRPRLRAPRPRTFALALLAVVAALVFGVTTATVQASLGPHVTRYDVTTDSTVTIDLGPLGTLQIDSPLPLTLGVRATVQEIPAQVTELGQATTLQALADDLTSYLQFFSGPEAAVRDVAVALAADAAARSLLALLVLVGVWWGVRLLLGADRRAQLTAVLRPYRRQAVAGALVLVLGATVLTSSVAPEDQPQSQVAASAVFDGTPLAGARVTGRLGGIIDTYGGYAVDAWRANEEFYARADSALAVAWTEWAEADARAAQEPAPTGAPDGQDGSDDASADVPADGAVVGDPAPAVDPAAGDGGDAAAAGAGADPADPDPAGPDAVDGAPTEDASTDDAPTDDAPADDAPTDDAPTDDATRRAAEEDPVEPVTLLVVSDLHCNVGMAPLVRTLAELAEVDAVLDAGDTTMNGTSVEQYCVTAFARAVPGGVPLVTAPGNHDSRDTTRRYARAGATVLDGSVVDVAGVRVLGDRDANETRVGGGTTTADDETPREQARRLAETACDAGDVDLLLLHTPTGGDEALDQGCVPAQVSGHYHRRVGPEQVGLGVRYISSSTAGATLGQPTVGPLRGVAELTLLRFDPRERRFLDVQVVAVSPDGSVEVQDRQPWPEVVVPEPEDATGEGTQDGTPDGTGEGTEDGAGDGTSGDGTDGPATPGTGDARPEGEVPGNGG
ncbi:metallophosphoesterase family protein [Cellulomonas shaoxiangyii]|uniref:Metallophosphoesterase n=1 Tax=Cellulomonas shaoxiangyii TaxID=2566013 RepID=A0A4P7SI83_9CELL|nr:metallophosphoesterase [Cellulomonas shaoxiangyii]QCB93227.1 metallophosphoesterase [Cellulomonas shaoxiangyii]TGY79243.1 metallophosphoesterase [Cellulomonas shaoxiangyii]